MKCPHCKKEISNELIAKALASKGGSKSKRQISPEQQSKMQAARRRRMKLSRHNNGLSVKPSAISERKTMKEYCKKQDCEYWRYTPLGDSHHKCMTCCHSAWLPKSDKSNYKPNAQGQRRLAEQERATT